MNPAPSTENHIPARWLPVVRSAWIGIAILLVSLYLAGLSPTYHALSELCYLKECRILTIAPAELNLLEHLGLSLTAYVLYYLVLEGFLISLFAALAGLVFWRRSDTWVGLVVSLAFLFAGFVFFAEETRAVARLNPEFTVFIDFLTSISVVLVLMLFYLFPDGRFTPHWMGWFAAALFLSVTLEPLLNRGGIQSTSTSMFVILTFAVGAPMGLVSQIHRFRSVSSQTQKQQTKWILYGFMGMFSGMLPWMLFAEITQITPGPGRLLFYLSLLPQYILIGFFPVSVVIAILRYRLWDIDLLIRRTLQYSLLSGLLGLTYFGSVIVLQNLLAALGSQQSEFAIVLSTLAIAALFIPLRNRVQDFIDRRFFRRKYDAQKVLAEFAALARDETDLDKLSTRLIEVVGDTMQPESVKIWLRDLNAEPQRRDGAED